jgi:hypothetical protein
MTDATTPSGERILIVLEPSHPSTSALAAAAAIAGDSKPRVHAVLIEDENVRRLGALAEAREVTLSTAQIRVPALETLERQLRANVREARRLFEGAAARFAFAATFEARQGPAISQLIRDASGERLLVIGRASIPVARAWWDPELPQLLAANVGNLAFVPAAPRGADGVVALLSDSEADDQASLMAQRIAAHAGMGVRRLPRQLPGALQLRRIDYLVVSSGALTPSRLRELILSYGWTVVVTR